MRLYGTVALGWGSHSPGIALSRADRDKWDERYRSGAYVTRRHPGALLADWIDRLEVSGMAPRAVDIACGAGRNAIFLARRGWHVDAVDISPVALERLRAAADAEDLSITCSELDLEPAAAALDGFRGQAYDLAVLMRYTDTSLVEVLPRAIAPGGYLIAEMHMNTGKKVAGPRSPRFRVAAGALRQAGAALDLLHYYEGLITDPDGRTVALAQLVGRRPASFVG